MRRTTILILLQLGALISVYGQSKRWTREQYIGKYYALAIQEMNLYKIPASIILAQGILETESGNSDLARIANNHFGIKCKKTWEGMKFIKDDDTKNECFRAYSSVEESYRDHSIFLQNERYASLFKLETRDYKSWSYGLRAAGYATNPNYPILLIKHIEELELYQFDNYGSTKKPVIKVDSSDKDLEEISSGLLDTNKLKLIAKFTSNDKANNLKFVLVDDNFDILALSQKTGSPVSYLFRCNDIDGPSQLYPGQNFFLQLKLKSNPLSIHEVKAGETLYEISQTYGVQLKALKKYNGINEWEQPEIGEIVYMNSNRTTPIKTRSLEAVLAEKKQMADEVESAKKKIRMQKELEFYLATATSNTKIPNTDKFIVFHQVKAKENIFKIAKFYNVKPNEVLEWNNLTLETGVSVGQTLKIISTFEPVEPINPKSKLSAGGKGTSGSIEAPAKNSHPSSSGKELSKGTAKVPSIKKSDEPTPKKIVVKDSTAAAPRILKTQNSATENSNVIKDYSTPVKSNKENSKITSKKNSTPPAVNDLEKLIHKTKTVNAEDKDAQNSSKKIVIVE